MKKVLVGCIIVFIMLAMGTVYATSSADANVLSTDGPGELQTMKDATTQEIQDYTERYGSDTYGLTAYILDKVRIYSIPFCFVGIAIGAIYQYVIGIRKLDVRDRGMILVVSFVTILVICQVLPLVFTIVVRGWRG